MAKLPARSSAKNSLRTGEELAEIYERHADMVYRVCFAYLKNAADAEDAVSDTFFRLLQAGTAFESAAHEKAWLLRVAANVCKNRLRHWWRRREPPEAAEAYPGAEMPEIDGTLAAVLALPGKYKTVLYLYYYECYTGAEIAELLQKPHSTVRNQLREARGLLKKQLGDDFCE